MEWSAVACAPPAQVTVLKGHVFEHDFPTRTMATSAGTFFVLPGLGSLDMEQEDTQSVLRVLAIRAIAANQPSRKNDEVRPPCSAHRTRVIWNVESNIRKQDCVFLWFLLDLLLFNRRFLLRLLS